MKAVSTSAATAVGLADAVYQARNGQHKNGPAESPFLPLPEDRGRVRLCCPSARGPRVRTPRFTAGRCLPGGAPIAPPTRSSVNSFGFF